MPTLQEALTSLVGENSPAQMALYALIQSMVSAAITPFIEVLEQQALSKLPVTPLSAAELADMVNRNLLTMDLASVEAKLTGYNAERFGKMVQAAGESPGVDVLARALRLSLIPEDSHDPNVPGFRQGIQQSRLRDMWTETIRQVARDFPTADTIVQAYLRGQISEVNARAQYEKLGGVPEYFELLFDTAGRPPSPAEAAEMVHRGLIPKEGIGAGITSFDQAVRESDLKDKWGDVFWKLSEAIPPPRTVVALVRAGTVSDDDALRYLQQAGLSASLAASYVAEAHHTRTAAERELAKGDVLTLYQAKALDRDQATKLLDALGYSDTDAGFMLDLYDFRQELANLNSAVSKFRSLFIAHKISRNDASTGLDHLGLTANHRDALLKIWQLERDANVRTLTPAEIRKLNSEGVLSDDDTYARLQGLGYSLEDAKLYLLT